MRHRLTLFLAIALIASACGGSTAPETSHASTTTTSSASTTSEVTTTTLDLFAMAPVIDVCGLMTVGEAEAILGAPLNRDPALKSDEYGDECDWNATVPRGTGAGPQTLWIRVVQSGRGGAGDGFESAEERFRDRVDTNGHPYTVVGLYGYGGLMDDLAGLIVILDADLVIQLRANTTDLMDTYGARTTQLAMAEAAVLRLAALRPDVAQPTTTTTTSTLPWDLEAAGRAADVVLEDTLAELRKAYSFQSGSYSWTLECTDLPGEQFEHYSQTFYDHPGFFVDQIIDVWNRLFGTDLLQVFFLSEGDVHIYELWGGPSAPNGLLLSVFLNEDTNTADISVLTGCFEE